MRKEVHFDDLLHELEKDPEFRNARRKIRPYFDLLKDILRRRKLLGITQKDLAEKANTHQSRISKIESGEHDIRLSTIITIAEALDSEVKIQLVPYEKVEEYWNINNIRQTGLVDQFGLDLDEFSEEKINIYHVRVEYE